MSRRKTHVLSFRDLSDEDVAAVQKIFEAKGVRVDPRTLTLTAAAPHLYRPVGLADFVERLRRYVETNGNRIVDTVELTKIGRVPRSTLARWVDACLVLPAEAISLQPIIYYPEPPAWYEQTLNMIKQSKARGDGDGLKRARELMRMLAEYTRFDLQKIVEELKYFITLHPDGTPRRTPRRTPSRAVSARKRITG